MVPCGPLPRLPCACIQARGLRAILEELLLDTMYDIPSRTDVRECTVTEDDVKAVTERQQAVLLSKQAS